MLTFKIRHSAYDTCMRIYSNILHKFGFTSLHYAVIQRNYDIIQVLMDNGATISLCSKVRSYIKFQTYCIMYYKNGSNPCEIAKSLGFNDIADILQSHMNLSEGYKPLSKL